MFTQGKSLWLPSPAKINLCLHICGRLDNGYHQLQTVFQLLDYGDSLGFELSPREEIKLHPHIPGVALEENLIYRAAKLLLPHRTKPLGINIHLKKVLPMGGGIGGGSSNAATTLLALNRAWECGLSNEALQSLGLSLGADVPLFVKGYSAFAEGLGEKLMPVVLPSKYYLVATPDVHVSTADIFQHPDLVRNSLPIEFTDYSFESSRNDCEKLVCKLHSKVAYLLQWLLHYAPSRMTGTGASVFSVFETKAQADEVRLKLPKHTKSFVAKGINRSPTHEILA